MTRIAVEPSPHITGHGFLTARRLSCPKCGYTKTFPAQATGRWRCPKCGEVSKIAAS